VQAVMALEAATIARSGKWRSENESICRRRLRVIAGFDAPSAAHPRAYVRWRRIWSGARIALCSKVRVSFEATRFGAQHLIEAYARLVPMVRRTSLPTQRSDTCPPKVKVVTMTARGGDR
jgi:hypothetical protein